jgi:hypothetical protein
VRLSDADWARFQTRHSQQRLKLALGALPERFQRVDVELA